MAFVYMEQGGWSNYRGQSLLLTVKSAEHTMLRGIKASYVQTYGYT